jgi:hypothetical protein
MLGSTIPAYHRGCFIMQLQLRQLRIHTLCLMGTIGYGVSGIASADSLSGAALVASRWQGRLQGGRARQDR